MENHRRHRHHHRLHNIFIIMRPVVRDAQKPRLSCKWLIQVIQVQLYFEGYSCSTELLVSDFAVFLLLWPLAAKRWRGTWPGIHDNHDNHHHKKGLVIQEHLPCCQLSLHTFALLSGSQ